MDTNQTSSQPLKSATNWLSLFQLVLSSLAVLFLLVTAAIIAISVFTQQFSQPVPISDSTQSLMIAASLAFAGLLIMPSAWYAGKRLANPSYSPPQWPEPPRFGVYFTLAVLVFVVGALLLGDWASTNSQVSWFLLPPLNIIATGLPALWVMYIGTRGLIPGSPSRRWGVFTSGLVLGPLVIILLEIFLLVVVGILALVWVLLDPNLSSLLESLALRVQNAGANPEAILRILQPFVTNPGLLILVFAYIAVMVPLVEEALKPIGVWLLAGKKLTPAQGFGYGVLSGTGFGLFENLGNTSTGGEIWVLLASTRISTLLLHALTAGLVGWALASAWTHKRYWRLAATYFLAVLMHGLWNGLAVLSFISTLDAQTAASYPPALMQAGTLSAAGIVALGAFNLVLFLGFSAALRRSVRSSAPSAALSLASPGEITPAPPSSIITSNTLVPDAPASGEGDYPFSPEVKP